MPRRTKTSAQPAHDNTLYQFSVDFFTLFGAKLGAPVRQNDASLEVQLSPELAGHFGRDQLSLCFHSAEPKAGQELVAHGSRALDKMLAFLEQRSAFTVQRLPQRSVNGDELLRAVQPVNASVSDLRIQEQMQLLFVFTWRITYRADDKRQELYSVVLDHDGVRQPQQGETDTPVQAMNLGQLIQDAEPPPLERTEEGHILPPKLPPVTHLVKLAETARKYAIYHADLRCVNHEAEILPRLHKSLNRLTTYYQQQIEEVYDSHDPDGEKRRVLEEDLNRKIAEEVENHRLRVQVDLVSYLVLETPVAALEMVVTDGKRQAAVRVVQNRYNGVLRRPGCHVCGTETSALAVDKGGHLICDACIQQCSSCQEILCSRCGMEACPVCGAGNCADCGKSCWACGGRACAAHISGCPVCGDEVCHACQSACTHCGVSQCRSHLYADAILGPNGAVGLICAACAVRCPGCQQYTVEVDVCTASGQRFCRNCLVACTSCGRLLGPGFYEISPVDQEPYCQDCRKECSTCGRITPMFVACHKCGAGGCPACTPRCSACRNFVCAEHGHRVAGCGHVLCTEHVAVCSIGSEAVCPVCSPPCAICERSHCAEHTRVCAQCGQEYCSECVRASGLCDTCSDVAKHGVSVDVLAAPWVGQPEVAKLAPYYRWVRQSNTLYTVYFGEGSMLSGAVIVARKTAEGERIVHTRRIGAVERLRGLLGS